MSSLATYVPERCVDNDYFSSLTGRPPTWFVERTGILTRRRASPADSCETMGVSAVQALAMRAEIDIGQVDLIIGATYTPGDTIGTLGHHVQRAFNIPNARVFHVSAACTSLLAAIEIASVFIETRRSRLALIVGAEHNSLYADDANDQSGHLWGDAATAFLLGSQVYGGSAYKIIDATTSGLGHIGQGPDGIHLRPKTGGIVMPHGKDVFANACRYMEEAANDLLHKHHMSTNDIRLLVPHQANLRIVERVADRLGVEPSRCAVTVRTYGNTGCVSPLLTLALHEHQVREGEYVLLVAFGGGYSVGAALLQRSTP